MAGKFKKCMMSCCSGQVNEVMKEDMATNGTSSYEEAIDGLKKLLRFSPHPLSLSLSLSLSLIFGNERTKMLRSKSSHTGKKFNAE
jgi:hypothetical protein